MNYIIINNLLIIMAYSKEKKIKIYLIIINLSCIISIILITLFLKNLINSLS
jgi:hypothetical protein